MLRVGGRLLLAALLGLSVGFERERSHKAAGLRTHMLVCLGAAISAMAHVTTSVGLDASSLVIQGVLRDIVFLGAGTILKLRDKAQVRGLTTAASVWLTAVLGVSAGLGHFWLPVIAAAIAGDDSGSARSI